MQLSCKILFALASVICVHAGEGPYFVTYSHQLEEPGSLEIASSLLTSRPVNGNRFLNNTLELEYGARGWWTTEVYLTGQSTAGERALLTGVRWENRLRPLLREHWINPVIYVEFEDQNGADKSLLGVVGHDGQGDLSVPNSEARRERKRELEAKLLLGSNVRGWNISENFAMEKNLGGGAWEFGYAVGMFRPLALAASPRECRLCRENFQLGAEMYGGLGTWHDFGLQDTSHYLAPVMSWVLTNGITLHVGPAFGLTARSARLLVRFGVSYEIAEFGRAVRNLFR